MPEVLVNIFANENRQDISELFLMILILCIAVIITIVYVGQRTRIKPKFAQSKIISQKMIEYEAVFTKCKTDPDNIRISKILKKKLI